MQEILISIKPQYSSLIYAEKKTIELRKKIGKLFEPNRKLFIYTSSPIKMLSGEAVISDIFCGPPSKIKSEYIAESSISSSEFDNYFSGHTLAYAIRIKNIKEYTKKIPLAEIRRLGITPPQSFSYFDATSLKNLKER